jgi:hypothetical protein
MYDLLTRDMFTPRGMMKLGFNMMSASAEAFKFMSPGRGGRAAWQEFQNKLETFDLFEFVDSALQLPAGVDLPLAALVERSLALGPYRAVWATEGVGHYHAERFVENGGAPRRLLSNESAGALPARSLTALHAGAGLSLANRELRKLGPRSDAASVGDALRGFVALCRDNAAEGYVGVMYESLGLVARNLYPRLVQVIDQQLSEMGDELHGYFWHGVGRALYFAPTNFLPVGEQSGRPFEVSQREPPHELGRRNALAGVVWTLFLVNIRHPEVLENLLKNQTPGLPDDAFVNGVSAATVVWNDSAPDDPYLTALCQYRGGGHWERSIRRPCEEALRRFYPVIKKHNCMGEVFRYRSLPELVVRLEEGRGAAPPARAA